MKDDRRPEQTKNFIQGTSELEPMQSQFLNIPYNCLETGTRNLKFNANIYLTEMLIREQISNTQQKDRMTQNSNPRKMQQPIIHTRKMAFEDSFPCWFKILYSHVWLFNSNWLI